MNSKRKLLKKSHLYLIVDEDTDKIDEIISSCPDLIQLRIKNRSDKFIIGQAKIIRHLCKIHGVLFIMNDRADLAKIAGADGLHLGQNDIDIKDARNLLGPDVIIGISTHSLKEAKKAEAQKPDYIAVGSIFKTATKPHLKPVGMKTAKKIIDASAIPYFVIGGINVNNITKLTKAGINRVAIYRAIKKSNSPAVKIKKIKGMLRNYEDTNRAN
jgi:thiamine-phosphate pyrophosphorylase